MRFPKWFGRSDPIEIKEVPSGLSNPEPWFSNLLSGAPIASGVSVTPESAMRCAPVASAVRRITETIGNLPVHVYRRGADDERERATDHPAYRLVNGNVSSWCSAAELRELVTRDALLHGSGFALIIRNGEGIPRGLEYLRATSVAIETDNLTGEPVYRVSLKGGNQRTYRAVDMIHIRSPLGSPMEQGREAIGLAMILERRAATLFKNGARPGGVIEVPDAVGEKSLIGMLTGWKASFGGEGNGLPAVLEKGASYKNVPYSSTDEQFIENRKLQVLEVCRIFNLPPILLQDYDRAIKSNAEEMGRQFLNYCLSTWIRRWEDEFHLKLFTEDEQEAFYAEFLVDELLRGDIETRSKAYALQIQSRILNPNEVRAMENRAPYEGGDTFENPNTTSALASSLTADKDKPDA